MISKKKILSQDSLKLPNLTKFLDNFDVNEHYKKIIDLIKSESIEYQLGRFIGEIIVRDHLPYLNKVHHKPTNLKFKGKIEILQEELDTLESLSSDMLEVRKEQDLSGELFRKYNSFYNQLLEKYLPLELKFEMNHFYVENITELKLGIKRSLHCSEFCYYDMDNFEIDQSELHFQIQKFCFKRKI